MLRPQTTEILGDMINYWDEFYAKNYSWLFNSLIEINQSEEKTKIQIEKAFIRLCLTHPQMVISGTKESIHIELAQIIPDLAAWIKVEDPSITSNSLLNKYYNPN